MKVGKKLASNSIYLFLDRFVISIFSLLFWIFLAKTISVSDYGIVATSINIVVTVSVFTSLGINLALSKLIPEFVAKNKYDIIKSYIWNSFKIISLTLLIVSILFLIFSNQIATVIKIPYDAVIIILVSIIFTTLQNLISSITYGLQKMRRFFITDIIGFFSRLLITLFLILNGFNYIGALIGFFLSQVVISITRLDLSYFSRKKSTINGKLLYYALPAFLTVISTTVIGYGHYIILSILKNITITGIFALSFTITNILTAFPSVLTSALFPIMSLLSAKKNTNNRQGYLLGLVVRYSLILIIPASIILILFSKYAVLVFSRLDFLSATEYFPFLVPAAVFLSFGNMFGNMLFAIGKPKIQRNITILTMILFLITSIPLTIYFSAIGMSIAYLLASLFIFISSLIFIRKYIKINFFVKDILKIFLSSIIIAFIFYIFKPLINDIPILIIFSIPIGILYLFILLFLKFYRREDIKLLEFIFWKIPLIKNIIRYFSKFIK